RISQDTPQLAAGSFIHDGTSSRTRTHNMGEGAGGGTFLVKREAALGILSDQCWALNCLSRIRSDDF
ncbi:MAG: hypothetical protein AAB177_13520, partial [Nitrospirota bacterium]